jgi:magnesium transporter
MSAKLPELPPPRRQPRRRAPPGAAPGTLHVDPEAPKPVLRAFVYGPSGLHEHRPTAAAAVTALRQPGHVLWLDVAGLGDAALLRELGERFGLHRLALEDTVNAHQRAKVEDYPEHLFLVLRMIDDSADEVRTEQLSLFLGDGFVATFQERTGDCWDTIRQRLQDETGRLRRSGPDYLAYSLLDGVVDAFFPVIETFGARLDAIEDDILAGVRPREVAADLHGVRRDMLVLRRALWPLRDVTHTLVLGDAPRIEAATRVYLRDVHDHVLRLIDLLESHREVGASLMEVHLASVSNRLNEVMKVLTVIATIFIPLTFVVGIYGMNFHHMPELDWWWAYPACWLLMLAIAASMLWWFRRRGWLR